MELNNTLVAYNDTEGKKPGLMKEGLDALIVLLSPFAPHITEELWHLTGHEGSIIEMSWPGYNEEALAVDEVEIVIQVNGKLKGKELAPAGLDKPGLEAFIKDTDTFKTLTDGVQVVKVVCVPNKLVNIVVKP